MTNFLNYNLKEGDSLLNIANLYQVSIDDILLYNKISITEQEKKQALIIPTTMSFKNYIVMPGDTLYKIAVKNNTNIALIKALNNVEQENIHEKKFIIVPDY